MPPPISPLNTFPPGRAVRGSGVKPPRRLDISRRGRGREAPGLNPGAYLRWIPRNGHPAVATELPHPARAWGGITKFPPKISLADVGGDGNLMDGRNLESLSSKINSEIVNFAHAFLHAEGYAGNSEDSSETSRTSIYKKSPCVVISWS